MNTDEKIKVNPNSAGIDELTQLTGIGPDIARRIINGRPYETLEDLTRINGIGPVLFDQIKTSLTIKTDEKRTELEEAIPTESETPEQEAEKEQVESDLAETQEGEPIPSETVEIQKEEEQSLHSDTLEEPVALLESESAEKGVEQLQAETTETSPETIPHATSLSRSSAIGWALFMGILSMLLSIVLSLGILASINGGSLKFATQTEFRQQQLALNELENQSKLLVDELDGMHERLANLEALSGRISTLEKSVGAVQGEMDVAHKQLDEFSGELEVLTEQIVRLSADVETYKAKLNRADTFFESMRNLLNNLYPEE